MNTFIYLLTYASLITSSLSLLALSKTKDLAAFGFVVSVFVLITFAFGFAAINGGTLAIICAVLTLPIEAIGVLTVGHIVTKGDRA